MPVNGDVILIKMPWQGPCDENLIPPLGLGALSEAMHVAGIDHAVVDLAAAPDDREPLLDDIRHRKPAVAAVSFGSAGYLRTYDFLNELKQANPHMRIIVGGWHPSSIGPAIFDECPAVDVSVVGPGERALIAVLTDTAAGLSNVLTRDTAAADSRVRLAECLGHAEWAFPRYTNMDLSPYAAGDARGIVTSRGCPSRCTFCSSKRVSGHGYLAREAADVAAEFDYHIAQGVRTFHILDDNMTLNMDRAMAIFETIVRFREQVEGFNITLPNGIRADRCSVELLTLAARCGVTTLLFGVESANDDMLKAMKKGETLDTIRRAVTNAFDVGLKVRLAFLVGMPGETPAHVDQSMAFVRSFGRHFEDIYINHPIPFPGTEMFADLDHAGLLTLPPSEYLNCPPNRYYGVEPIFETPEMSFDDRNRMYEQFLQLRNDLCPARYAPPAPAFRPTYRSVRGLLRLPHRLLRKVIRRIGPRAAL